MKIRALQALRFWAFLGILFAHCGIRISWPWLGVSIFFVLSGFVLSVSDKDDANQANCFRYLFKRMKKIYPIHLATAFIVFGLNIIDYIFHNDININLLMLQLVANVLLIQSWIPSYVLSLNGVAWFLSTIAFSYFLFPLISKLLPKGQKKVYIILFATILLEGVISAIVKILLVDNSTIAEWITYYFPPFRCLEFVVGCALGKIYKESTVKTSKKTFYIYSLTEIITLLTIIGFRLFMHNVNFEVIVNRTFPYTIVSTIIVFCFAKNEGIVSKILTLKPFEFIGQHTGNMFLIHYVIIIFFERMVQHFGRLQLLINKTNRFAICFLISLITSMLYGLMVKKIKSIRTDKNK